MNVEKLLSLFDKQEGNLCITDGESDLYIGGFNILSINDQGEWLPKAWIVGLKSNTDAISGSRKINIALEVTVGNWCVPSEYDY